MSVAMWMIEQARHEQSLVEPYGWIITRDRNHEINEAHRAAGAETLNDDASEVGMIGPRSIPADIEARLHAGEGVEFRLLDEGDLDDCNDNEHGAVAEGHPEYSVVFEGRLIDPSGEWPTAPLDDFGAYRANGIQYRGTDGRWADA
jgi:hypothetical protein